MRLLFDLLRAQAKASGPLPAPGSPPPAPIAQPGQITLPLNAVWRPEQPGQSVRICCEFGRVWLTQSNNPRDVILEPGQEVQAGPNSNLIVQALEPSRIRVREA